MGLSSCRLKILAIKQQTYSTSVTSLVMMMASALLSSKIKKRWITQASNSSILNKIMETKTLTLPHHMYKTLIRKFLPIRLEKYSNQASKFSNSFKRRSKTVTPAEILVQQVSSLTIMVQKSWYLPTAHFLLKRMQTSSHYTNNL